MLGIRNLLRQNEIKCALGDISVLVAGIADTVHIRHVPPWATKTLVDI